MNSSPEEDQREEKQERQNPKHDDRNAGVDGDALPDESVSGSTGQLPASPDGRVGERQEPEQRPRRRQAREECADAGQDHANGRAVPTPAADRLPHQDRGRDGRDQRGDLEQEPGEGDYHGARPSRRSARPSTNGSRLHKLSLGVPRKNAETGTEPPERRPKSASPRPPGADAERV